MMKGTIKGRFNDQFVFAIRQTCADMGIQKRDYIIEPGGWFSPPLRAFDVQGSTEAVKTLASFLDNLNKYDGE